MSNRSYCFFFLALFCCLLSCSEDKKLGNTTSKEAYISHLHALSDNALEKQLKQDAEYLNALLDSVSDLSFYYAFGLGLGVPGSSSGTPDSAEAFTLPSKAFIIEDFNNPMRKLYFEQALTLPQASYSLWEGNEEEGFTSIKVDDLDFDIGSVFLGNQAVAPGDVKLQRADSIDMLVMYRFPTGFDTLNVGLQEKEVQSGPYTLEVDVENNQAISIVIPLELSNKIIDYRGVTPDGILINSSSYSKFPITVISPDIINTLESLQKALQSGDRTQVEQHLEASPTEVLEWINQVDAFYTDFLAYEGKNFEDSFDAVKGLKVLLEEYEDIMGVKEMQYELEFPNDIQEIQFYAASTYDSLSRRFIVENYFPEDASYQVYFDKELNSYGVADASGQILIPATYSNLSGSGDFFSERKGDETFSYRLDATKKVLEPLPEGLQFSSVLDTQEQYYSYTNASGKLGVMDNEFNEILPFRFEDASLYGNIFVMRVRQRGRLYAEFYTKDGKQIQIPGKISQVGSKDDAYIIIRDRNEMSGVINQKGELTVTPQYFIDIEHYRLSDRLVGYAKEDTYDAPMGIIDAETGNTILSHQDGFSNISPFEDGLAAATFNHDGQRAVGYINEKGNVVLPAAYTYGTRFHKGLACVETPDNKIHLINKKGEVVKRFPDRLADAEGYNYRNYGQQKIFEGRVIYDINDEFYDDQGNPFNLEMIEQLED